MWGFEYLRPLVAAGISAFSTANQPLRKVNVRKRCVRKVRRQWATSASQWAQRHVTCLLGHVIDLRILRCRQLFLPANPKQTNMADNEDRRRLLGDEDEVPSSSRQTPREPGRPMPAICDPNHLLHRIVVLVFMCFLGFGEPCTPNSYCGGFGTKFNRLHLVKSKLIGLLPIVAPVTLNRGGIIMYVVCKCSSFFLSRKLLLLWQPGCTSNSSHAGNSSSL